MPDVRKGLTVLAGVGLAAGLAGCVATSELSAADQFDACGNGFSNAYTQAVSEAAYRDTGVPDHFAEVPDDVYETSRSTNTPDRQEPRKRVIINEDGVRSEAYCG